MYLLGLQFKWYLFQPSGGSTNSYGESSIHGGFDAYRTTGDMVESVEVCVIPQIDSNAESPRHG